MPNIIRLKRRAAAGAAGAPVSLKTTEVAFNEADQTLYVGFGDDGAANATSIIPLAGRGAFADLTTAQTLAGIKTFSVSPIAPTPAPGDNTTKVATTAFVSSAISGGIQAANTVQAGPTTGAASAPTYRALVSNDIPALASTKISDFSSAADARIALQRGANSGLCELDATGFVPVGRIPGAIEEVLEFANLAAFPVTGATSRMYVALDNNRVYRWSGTVYIEISAAPGSTDAVTEGSINLYHTVARVIASALTGLSLVTATAVVATDSILIAIGKLQAQVTARLVSANNLSDLASAPTARTNLGLGTMATQAASGVVITGGTIDNVTLDGGTF